MNRIKKIGLGFSAVLTLLIVSFFCLSDMSKAKLSLKIFGLHKENVADFSDIKDMILDNQFTYCLKREDIPPHVVELIEKHHNSNNRYHPNASLSDIYAIDREECNLSCQPKSDLPNMVFNELYFCDDALIISYLSGGIGVSNYFDFYNIKADSLSLIGRTNSYGPDIFLLAVILKSEGDMIDYTKDIGDFLQTN